MENAGPDDVKEFPFLVLGNKLDMEPLRKVDSKDAQEWCKVHEDIPFFETSAKEGVSVEQAF